MIKDNKDITMAQLAIKGHITRGKEVIEIFEMLGGKNKEEYTGENNHLWYYINERDEISIFTHSFDDCNFFTLEEFLEKYPYKAGDKVYYDNKICDVIEMLWNNNLNTISYGVYDGRFKNLAIVEELKSYKKETMETITIDDFKANTKEWLIDKLHGMIISNAIKTIGNIHDELHKPEYPKTYEKCCEVLDIESEWHLTFELNNSASCGLCLTKEFEYICKLVGDGQPAMLIKNNIDNHTADLFAVISSKPLKFDNSKYKVALRVPEKSNVDASEIARRYGGNGHIKAAGCIMTLDEFNLL